MSTLEGFAAVSCFLLALIAILLTEIRSFAKHTAANTAIVAWALRGEHGAKLLEEVAMHLADANRARADKDYRRALEDVVSR